MNFEKLGEADDEQIKLGLLVRHSGLQRVEEPEGDGGPEVFYADKIEEHEPALFGPNPPPQLTDKMGFAITGRSDENPAKRSVTGCVPHPRLEVIHDVVGGGAINLRDVIVGIGPHALQLPRVIKIDGAESGDRQFRIGFAHYFVIQRI